MLSILLKVDYPAFAIPHQCSSDTKIGQLKSVLDSDAGFPCSPDDYSVRSARFGGDVIPVEDDDETLVDLEISTGATIMFFAPPDSKFRPARNLSKAEEEKQKEKKSKKAKGFGKYKDFDHGNCFKKAFGRKKQTSQLAFEYIEAEAKKLFNSTINDEFLGLQSSELATVLQLDRLNIAESSLYLAVEEWGKKNKGDVKSLLTHVRFPTMQATEISSVVAKSGLFDGKTVLALYTHTSQHPNVRPTTLAGFTEKQCEPRNPRTLGTLWVLHGDKIVLTENKRGAKYNGNGWQGSVQGSPCARYSVKITNAPSKNFMIGFTDRASHKLQGNNYGSNTGYYLYTSNGRLYGKGKSNTTYYSSCGTTGTIITCIWDKDAKTVSFMINGQNKGVAYSNTADDIVPAIDFNDNNSAVELVDSPE